MSSVFIENMFALNDKVALVTGAAGGIGSHVSVGLAKSGASVAICDIDGEKAKLVADEIIALGHTAKAYTLDVCSLQSIDQVVGSITKEMGGLDILINCAGINRRQPMLEVEEQTFDKIMGVNIKGLYFLSKRCCEYMKEHGGGRIVNFGSLTSSIGLGDVSVYTAAKGAVSQLSKTMAIEWGKYNINVNVICPGFIKTPLTTPLWESGTRKDFMLSRIILDRPGTPEDLVGTIIFLCSNAASYITGTVHFVDGGVIAGGKSW